MTVSSFGTVHNLRGGKRATSNSAAHRVSSEEKTVNFYQCAAAYLLESIPWLLKSLKIPPPSEEESVHY
jgi:hypothetical protein